MDAPLLDFDTLRSRALAVIQRLAGSTWTDHNSHDPGITILEALCYALTDLGYRSTHDLCDLIAGDDLNPGLATPAQALTSAPLTLDDWRRLVIDLAGVKNAWIEPYDDTVASYDAALQQIAPPLPAGSTPPSPNIQPVVARGLYRVSIEKSGWGEDVDGGVLVQRATQRLQRWRGLGEDFAVVRVLAAQPVALDVALEIDAATDPAQLLAALYAAVADYCSPAVPVHSLREMIDRGWAIDRIFEGPLLDRGFIDADELRAARRRDALRISDLIRIVTALPGVAAVKSLKFIVDGRVSDDWLRSVDADRCAALDIGRSSIRLHRRGVRVDQPAVAAAAQSIFERRMRAAAARSVRIDEQRDLPAPVGRDRHLARYRPVLELFPLAWGVGPAGLPADADEQRRAEAAQLKAYVQIFDQLLANQFAQLAGARRLFAADDPGTQSYFAQPVADDDGTLGLAALRIADAPGFAARLQAITEDPWQGPPAPLGLRRRGRILDHLLARFGERYADHTLLVASAKSPEAILVRDKQAFLRDLPRIGHDRGVARNLLATDDGLSGLELRLARRFGLQGTDERFALVEHVLLRPLQPDREQRGPLMKAALAPDPYSLRIVLVCAGAAGRLADPNFRAYVEQVARDEAPAHLALRVLWLDAAAYARFERLYAAFAEQWRRALLAQSGTGAKAPGWRLAPLRSVRNRLIDLLGIGDTAPLPDLRFAADKITVAFGTAAVVTIEDAEDDVDYELRGPDGQPLKYKDAATAAAAVTRRDGRIELTTPAITEDVTLRVKANKRFGSAGARWLDNAVAIKVGLDTQLAISFVGVAVLDPDLPRPQPGDARIADFGANVQVRIDASQEGVEYQLVLGEVELAPVTVGNLAAIVLDTGPVSEDVTIAVKATKRFPPSSRRDPDVQRLDATLALKVRANPGLAAQIVPAAVADFRAAASVRVAATQAGVRYRLWARRVRDADWQHDDAAPGAWIAAVPGVPRVAVPAKAGKGDAPAGFVAQGDAQPGTGGPLDLDLPPAEFDSLVLVQAIKTHVADPGSKRIDSRVMLDQALLQAVRPDPEVRLSMRVAMSGAATDGPIALAGGEPGVFYALLPAGTTALPQAGYFHQRDERNAARNKGLGQIAVGIDFAIAMTPRSAVADPAATPPELPQLDSPPLAAGTTIAVRATRAMTGLDCLLKGQATVAPLPPIALASEVVDFRAAASVTITASVVGERYALRRAGVALGEAIDGDGNAQHLSSDALVAATTLELELTRPAADGLPLTRVVRFAVAVRPDTGLVVSARDAAVGAGAGTVIVVAASEWDVVYQLIARGRAVGKPLPGDGSALELPTGPLSTATTFSVSAVRAGDARSTATLAATAKVGLLAGS